MAVITQFITRTGALTVMAPGTTPTPAFTELPEESTDHTGAPALARATTRAPELTPVAPLPMDHTERAARRRPITRAPVLTLPPARDRTFMAVGDRHTCSVVMIGQTPSGSPTVREIRRVLHAEIRVA